MEVVTNEKRKDYEVMTKRFGFSAMHTAKRQGFTLAEVIISMAIMNEFDTDESEVIVA